MREGATGCEYNCRGATVGQRCRLVGGFGGGWVVGALVKALNILSWFCIGKRM